jgi:hypothetical protein
VVDAVQILEGALVQERLDRDAAEAAPA